MRRLRHRRSSYRLFVGGADRDFLCVRSTDGGAALTPPLVVSERLAGALVFVRRQSAGGGR